MGFFFFACIIIIIIIIIIIFEIKNKKEKNCISQTQSQVTMTGVQWSAK